MQNSKLIETAEITLIGELMKGGRGHLMEQPEIQTLLPEDFLDFNRGKIFGGIRKIIEDGFEPDLIVLEAFGYTTIAEGGKIIIDMPCCANPEFYAQQIKSASNIRRASHYAAKSKKRWDDIESGSTQEIEPVLDDIRRYLDEFSAVVQSSTSKTSKFPFSAFGEMETKELNWLIKNYLEIGSLVGFIGAPEAGKSLLAVDIALCCASGTPFCGEYAVKSGPVFYINGEGHNGLTRRIKGLCFDRGIDNRVDLYISHQPASLLNEDSLAAVIAGIDASIEKTGQKPVLIVIDTLARNYGPGNENSTEDMTRFIGSLDRLLNRYGATILLVHHTGHGDQERGRGSSVLKAALDAEYKVHKKGDQITFSCTKMKDAAHPQPLCFSLKEIEFKADDDSLITSVVLEKQNDLTFEESKPKKMGKNQQLALDRLEELFFEARPYKQEGGQNPDNAKVSIELWRKRCDLPINRFEEAKKGLVEKNLVSLDSQFVELL
ncbi:AAA family ATPase [Methylomonas rapida]|uniref:AAA family ATPase n=1 Tax=Methylomonas rapida TaxID=2963939 RepID=A0ABY7GKA2_9GAMM|nr:AAA family ATPase [Methylomonas rapida]WAR44608.1 AAA family ATPase [Methylomonas rapida]